MYSFFTVVYVLVCFFMVIIVLLQQGKGSGMGAAFGGGGQTLFGTGGKSTPLQKATTVMAFLFMALSVALASMSGGDDSALYQPPAEHPVGLQEEHGAAGDDSADNTGGDEAEKQAQDIGSKTEPAKTEPAKTEPAKTEPAKTEPAKTEPAK